MPASRLKLYRYATALIGLSRIDRLELLAVLAAPARVTARVWAEVTADPTKPGVAELLRARQDGLLLIVDEGDPNAFPQLDAGESTVLSAATAAGAAVLIDERKARALLDTEPDLKRSIPLVTGVVGLLLLAKRRGRIPAVRPLLDALIHHSFWISPSFYLQILRLANER